ncbi:SurA N-terminal domain-containing protein [Limnohabitans sp. Rim8]|uniref:SurA N-terminal domain-containing protein n=1 Tax=Limnohabitans sp. Rim8 TaxID=1100718 RepID=UPI0033057CFA
MFDFVRNNTKMMMGLLFLLIIPSFAMFGMDGYTRFNDQGAVVAHVDGNKINQADWDNAHKREIERIRAQMPNVDAKLFDSPEARYATLDRMVQDQVLVAAAKKLQLTTSDARLARELQQNPAIASLRGADGKLDMERYRQLVGSQGLSPEMFEAQVRNDLSTRQVMQGFQYSAFTSKAQAEVGLNAYFQRRDVQIQRFSPAEFLSKVQVSEDDVKAYYQSNAANFKSPESADVEYLVLDLESVRQNITVNEADLKTYYEQNAQKMAAKEERRASHILINAPKDASAADKQKAKTKAQELLDQVRKKPAAFAELAKQNSQDPGSASKGGDLDFFPRGAMVKPFDDAAFALKKSEISEVIESDFGYHIILLTDIKTPKTKSFEEMRPEMEAELKKQQAQRKFAELAETFTNGVYEQAESLKPVAERLKLTVQKASQVTRNPAQGVKGPLANSKFLQALFSEDATQKRRNTEAVEIGPSMLAAGHVVSYTPSATRPLADVKDQVRKQLEQERAANMAREAGKARLAAWKVNADGAALGASLVISRDQPQNQMPALVDAALRTYTATLPAWTGVDLGEQGYAVIRVNKVLARELDSKEKVQQAQQQYTQLWAAAEAQAYLAQLKQLLKVEIVVPKPNKATGKTELVSKNE